MNKRPHKNNYTKGAPEYAGAVVEAGDTSRHGNRCVDATARDRRRPHPQGREFLDVMRGLFRSAVKAKLAEIESNGRGW